MNYNIKKNMWTFLFCFKPPEHNGHETQLEQTAAFTGKNCQNTEYKPLISNQESKSL